MSLPKIGGTLVLDNEAQFKKALAEVNQGSAREPEQHAAGGRAEQKVW